MSQNLSSAAVVIGALRVNSFSTSCNFFTILIATLTVTVANSLGPDQARQNIQTDLDPIIFDFRTVFSKFFCFFKSVNKSLQNYPGF